MSSCKGGSSLLRAPVCDNGQAVALRGPLLQPRVRKAASPSPFQAQHNSTSAAAGSALPWSALRQLLASSALQRGSVACHTSSNDTSKHKVPDSVSAASPPNAASLQAALAAFEHAANAAAAPASSPTTAAAAAPAIPPSSSTSPQSTPPSTAAATQAVDKRSAHTASAPVSSLRAPAVMTLPTAAGPVTGSAAATAPVVISAAPIVAVVPSPLAATTSHPAVTIAATGSAAPVVNAAGSSPVNTAAAASHGNGNGTIRKAAVSLPPAPAVASGSGLPVPSAATPSAAPVSSGSGTPSGNSSTSPAASPPGTPGKESSKESKSSKSSSSSSSAGSAASAPHQHQHPPGPIITSSASGFQLQPMHVALFSLIFIGGALFATMTLQFTSDMRFTQAVHTVARRVAKSVAFRQLCVIACAILLVRFGLNNVLQALARFTSSPVQWDKSKLYYVVREVYQPLELLLFIAAICTLADSFVPQLIAVPKATVTHVVKCTLSVSFILGAATVIFNLKSRWCKENAWQGEMKGDVTSQRRWEAYDKLGTFIIYAMTFVLGIQAIGLEVTSVLAIGGIGGLAIGLAGREICENLLNGLIIMTTNPFEVGDEVHFFHTSKQVEGIVLDIGWYRTLIRSFEREVYVIPNAVFSKNIVLNISRKHREWRFHENISIRVQDVDKSSLIIQDIRRIVRNDPRVMNKLHRRIFLDKVSLEDARIYISFYCEASNREAFMTIKQDMLLAFIDCVERNGARLSVPRTVVDMDPEVSRLMAPLLSMVSKAMSDTRTNTPHGQGERGGNLLADGHTISAEASSVNSASKSKSSSGDSGSSTNGNGTGYSSGFVVSDSSKSGSGAGEVPEKRKSGSSKDKGDGGGGGGSSSSNVDTLRLQPQLAYAGGVGVVNNVVDAPAAATPVRPAAGDPNHPIVWALTKVASALFETPIH